MSKTKVLKKLAKKRGWKVHEHRLKKVKASDMAGIPLITPSLAVKRVNRVAEAIRHHEKMHKEAAKIQRHQWNLAFDYVINDILREWHIPDTPETPERFKDKSASEIYDLLLKEMG